MVQFSTYVHQNFWSLNTRKVRGPASLQPMTDRAFSGCETTWVN